MRRPSGFGIFCVYVGKEIFLIGSVLPNNPAALGRDDTLRSMGGLCSAPRKRHLEASTSQGS